MTLGNAAQRQPQFAAAQAQELLPAVGDAYKQVADAIAMFR